ncbi:MAG: hypothetical protein J6C26_00690, partial [Clostridia bacterium]|nr:hypothetical protein [Clostridia bacterium]
MMSMRKSSIVNMIPFQKALSQISVDSDVYPNNPSVTAAEHAVPPPFTQGRLNFVQALPSFCGL